MVHRAFKAAIMEGLGRKRLPTHLFNRRAVLVRERESGDAEQHIARSVESGERLVIQFSNSLAYPHPALSFRHLAFWSSHRMGYSPHHRSSCEEIDRENVGITIRFMVLPS